MTTANDDNGACQDRDCNGADGTNYFGGGDDGGGGDRDDAGSTLM